MGRKSPNVDIRRQQTSHRIGLELPGHRYLRHIDRNGINAFAAYFYDNVTGNLNVVRREVQRGTRRPQVRADLGRRVHADSPLHRIDA